MKKIFETLHEKAVQIAKTYLRAESELIAVLQEIDNYHAYRDLGYKSLFEYATQALKLSEVSVIISSRLRVSPMKCRSFKK